MIRQTIIKSLKNNFKMIDLHNIICITPLEKYILFKAPMEKYTHLS